MTPVQARLVVRAAKKNPRITSKAFLINLNNDHANILRPTQQQTLNKSGLYGHRPRKTPLQYKVQIGSSSFCKSSSGQRSLLVHSFCRLTRQKLNCFYIWYVAFVWRGKKSIQLEHGGGSIMLWGCF